MLLKPFNPQYSNFNSHHYILNLLILGIVKNRTMIGSLFNYDKRPEHVKNSFNIILVSIN